jgi:alkylation response protein AidB-like acyl-CoA dehydrogenase
MTSSSDERAALAEAVAGLLSDHDPVSSVADVVDGPTGYRARTYDLLAEQGLLGLLVPENLGGSGGGYGDIVVVCTEMGGALLPGPFASSAVAATTALVGAAGGSAPGGAEELLGALVSGERTAALVDGGSLTVSGSAQEGYLLNGAIRRAVGAATADVLLVAVGAGTGLGAGAALLAVDRSAVRVSEIRLADSTRRAAELRFEDVTVAAGAILAVGEDAEAAVRRADLSLRIALAADSVGGAREALELANAYAKTRVQFGRPIGSFQAIKHKLASSYVAVQSSAAVVAEAADAVDLWNFEGNPPVHVARTVTAAAAHCTSSYVAVAGDAIQTHGGIGFTWEHPCHRYFKRAWLNQAWLGGETAMHLTVADLLAAKVDLAAVDGEVVGSRLAG